jgi:hypothetical protein
MQNEDRNPNALESLVTEIIAPSVDFSALSKLSAVIKSAIDNLANAPDTVAKNRQ